ncbi:MAG: trehalose-phosphatase [Phycisphaeraceae bacterium]|nr:trehalose-phosphatase [Phycisphaeraceae bacterium]
MNDATRDIEMLASAPVLLVASDFDGTLAELAPRPDAVRPNLEALDSLRELGELPRTFTAVISGRALSDLSLHLPDEKDLKLFGSHGGEGSWRLTAMTPEQKSTLVSLTQGSHSLAARFAGSLVEEKPFGVAFHYRSVDRVVLPRLLMEIQKLGEQFPNATRLRGIEVVEFLALEANKGRCLEWLTSHVGASRTVFLGDDTTDESAFAVLRAQDIGIKVGSGETVANRRIADPAAVGVFLRALADARKIAIERGTADQA